MNIFSFTVKNTPESNDAMVSLQRWWFHCLVQWNWFSDVTGHGCTWVTCIQWYHRNNFTAPGCMVNFDDKHWFFDQGAYFKLLKRKCILLKRPFTHVGIVCGVSGIRLDGGNDSLTRIWATPISQHKNVDTRPSANFDWHIQIHLFWYREIGSLTSPWLHLGYMPQPVTSGNQFQCTSDQAVSCLLTWLVGMTWTVVAVQDATFCTVLYKDRGRKRLSGYFDRLCTVHKDARFTNLADHPCNVSFFSKRLSKSCFVFGQASNRWLA